MRIRFPVFYPSVTVWAGDVLSRKDFVRGKKNGMFIPLNTKAGVMTLLLRFFRVCALPGQHTPNDRMFLCRKRVRVFQNHLKWVLHGCK